MDATAIKEKMHNMLQGIEGYNPHHLPALEAHLAWQFKENEYDFEANLIMLRLYQFNPEIYNPDAVVLILLKAIANLPFTDLTLCKYLIQTDRLMEEPLCKIVELGNLLETCQFHEFWETLKENSELVGNIGDWTGSVRTFIAYVIDTTYQRIPKTLLMSLLNITSENEMSQVLETRKWRLCDASEVESEGLSKDGQWIFISNHEASVKSTKIKEKVTFEAMASMANAFKPSGGEFFIQSSRSKL